MAQPPKIRVRIDARADWLVPATSDRTRMMYAQYDARLQAMAHRLQKEVAMLLENQMIEGSNPLFEPETR
jgi:hypothetical protein